MRTLNASCDNFPVCLALVEHSQPDTVVGHAKLSPLPDRDDALMVESGEQLPGLWGLISCCCLWGLFSCCPVCGVWLAAALSVESG